MKHIGLLFKILKRKTKKQKKKTKAPEVLAVSYPNIGYGNYTKPKQENILIKNATVWTSDNGEF